MMFQLLNVKTHVSTGDVFVKNAYVILVGEVKIVILRLELVKIRVSMGDVLIKSVYVIVIIKVKIVILKRTV